MDLNFSQIIDYSVQDIFGIHVWSNFETQPNYISVASYWKAKQ